MVSYTKMYVFLKIKELRVYLLANGGKTWLPWLDSSHRCDERPKPGHPDLVAARSRLLLHGLGGQIMVVTAFDGQVLATPIR